MVKNEQSNVEVQQLLERFIKLANDIKDEGKPAEMINAALILASCTYATYVAAGNEGYLKEGGVNKMTSIYRKNLASLQHAKKRQFNPDGKP
jgi:hypothetical protein